MKLHCVSRELEVELPYGDSVIFVQPGKLLENMDPALLPSELPLGLVALNDDGTPYVPPSTTIKKSKSTTTVDNTQEVK